MSKTNIQILGEEKDKIYRLNRRLDALTELLEKVDNGTLSVEVKNTNDLANSLKNDIELCKTRIQKWWNIIIKKYNLPRDKKFMVYFESGEVVIR